jgi:hypothetical protein
MRQSLMVVMAGIAASWSIVTVVMKRGVIVSYAIVARNCCISSADFTVASYRTVASCRSLCFIVDSRRLRWLE